MTPDTPELAKRYGKAKNHRGTSFGYPIPKLLALLGFWRTSSEGDRCLPTGHGRNSPACRRCLGVIAPAVAAGGPRTGELCSPALLMRADHGCFRASLAGRSPITAANPHETKAECTDDEANANTSSIGEAAHPENSNPWASRICSSNGSCVPSSQVAQRRAMEKPFPSRC